MSAQHTVSLKVYSTVQVFRQVCSVYQSMWVFIKQCSGCRIDERQLTIDDHRDGELFKGRSPFDLGLTGVDASVVSGHLLDVKRVIRLLTNPCTLWVETDRMKKRERKKGDITTK